MNWWDTALVLAALLALTVLVGILMPYRNARRRTQARHTAPRESVQPARLGAERLGDRATLLQFSSASGRWCAVVHRTLADVATDHDGVLHLDIDVSDRPDIAAHFGVAQTPTTLVLDRDGVEQARFSGTPGRDVLDLEVNRVIAEHSAV